MREDAPTSSTDLTLMISIPSLSGLCVDDILETCADGISNKFWFMKWYNEDSRNYLNGSN